MSQLRPILVTELLPELDELLISLLSGLSERQWREPTVCPDWSVKDIAAHLLDGNIRRLSAQRDGFTPDLDVAPNSHRQLVDHLNNLNRTWIEATRRLSPRLLVELLQITGKQFCGLMQSLDPFEPALWPVAWAGESASANWFDTAREYSEKWLHQQQIRLAVGAQSLTARRLYFPVLDTFMRALPHAYRNAEAPDGTALQFTVTGEAGGRWFLSRADGRWKLCGEAECDLAAQVEIGQDAAWLLFSKSLDADRAREAISIAGDEELGSEVLRMICVMA